MKRKFFLLMFVLLLGLAACAAPGAAPEDPTEPPVTESPGDPTDVPDEISPDTILLQLEYEPTFFRQEAFYPFGRIPTFTLYADGTVIYLDEGEAFNDIQVRTINIGSEAAMNLWQDVMDAGFPGLEDHTDFCGTDASGQEVCIADAAVTVVRAWTESGDLREVRSYAGFSNDPGALDEIVLIMDGFSDADAVPYMPEAAALFIRSLPGDFEMPIRLWPLGDDRQPVPGLETSVLVLTGEDLATFIEGVGSNTGEFYFGDSNGTFSVYLIPWLPYTDYAQAAQEAFPAVTPGPVEEPFMTIQQTAVANLAMALGIPEDEITVAEFDQVTWPNGCLGIEYLDRACTEALVPGYRLILEAGGEKYEYRSDENGSVVLPAMPTDLPPVETDS